MSFQGRFRGSKVKRALGMQAAATMMNFLGHTPARLKSAMQRRSASHKRKLLGSQQLFHFRAGRKSLSLLHDARRCFFRWNRNDCSALSGRRIGACEDQCARHVSRHGKRLPNFSSAQIDLS